jgi:predicted nucleic acid-binding protein
LTSYRKPYVESSVFIAFIKGEMRDNGTHDCKKAVDSILELAERGKFKIFTSTLTVAEVFKKKNANPLTSQENDDLRPYFRESYIQLIEVDRDIAERANELCRLSSIDPQGRALRPNDAIHIACAERAGCDVLFAYDPGMIKQTHPNFSITWPEEIRPEPENLKLPLTGEELPLMLPADNEKGA